MVLAAGMTINQTFALTKSTTGNLMNLQPSQAILSLLRIQLTQSLHHTMEQQLTAKQAEHYSITVLMAVLLTYTLPLLSTRKQSLFGLNGTAWEPR